MEQIVESKAKCPKCKSDNLYLIETWKQHDIQWEQVGGKFDRNDGTLEPGYPYKVHGECQQCKHQWTFRGITQIDELIP